MSSPYRWPSLFFVPLFSFAGMLTAQGAPSATGEPLQPAPADPAITHALAAISPDRIRSDIGTLVAFGNRNTLSSMETDLPPGKGINAAADWIEAEFRRYSAACNNCLEVKRDTFTEPGSTTPGSRITRPTRLVNVYAVLRGSDPAQAARRVLVTGHYDSRVNDVMDTHAPAPGANDDASGVAVSLECARVLSQLHLAATVVFVAVAGEEQGLNGSRHLAQLAKSEGWQLEAVLNNDIVGGDTTPGETAQDKSAVRVFSEGVPGSASPEEVRRILALGAESDSPSRELARTIREVASTYFPAANGARSSFRPVLIFRRDRFLRGGDHTSFNAEGFAAVRFTEWRENFDHQHQALRTEHGTEYGDLLKFVDAGYVGDVARLNAATLATLAAAPPPPVEVRVLTESLDNNTELTWQPGPGAPSATTYEVVWRATEAPTWTTVATAGAATRITLPVSKDNVVFAVRSVDTAGHRSVAVLPTPARAANPKPASTAK